MNQPIRMFSLLILLTLACNSFSYSDTKTTTPAKNTYVPPASKGTPDTLNTNSPVAKVIGIRTEPAAVVNPPVQSTNFDENTPATTAAPAGATATVNEWETFYQNSHPEVGPIAHYYVAGQEEWECPMGYRCEHDPYNRPRQTVTCKIDRQFFARHEGGKCIGSAGNSGEHTQVGTSYNG